MDFRVPLQSRLWAHCSKLSAQVAGTDDSKASVHGPGLTVKKHPARKVSPWRLPTTPDPGQTARRVIVELYLHCRKIILPIQDKAEGRAIDTN